MTATQSVFLCAVLSLAAQPEAVEPKVVEPRKDYPEEYHPALKDTARPIPDLLLYGPDAPECVKFEPAGLRITLPLGYPNQRPGTGVVTDFGLKGDFEITMAFEIIADKDVAPPASWANLRVAIVPNESAVPGVWHKANQNRAGLAREVNRPNSAGTFLANVVKWNPAVPKDQWGNEDFSKVEQQTNLRSNTAALTGRLRLVRSGAEMFFFTSEDADKNFKLLHKTAFGTKDLKNVRLLASTGGPRAALDVLVTDLHIRADGLVKSAVAPLPPPAAEPRSLVIPVIIALAILGVLAVSLPVVVWLSRRKHQAKAPSTPAPNRAGILAIACTHCGKKIKTKRKRAGKIVKCPQCSNAVKVPRSPPDNAEDIS